MKTFIIKENEAGQRFDKYLKKLLKEAPEKEYCIKWKKGRWLRKTECQR